MQSAIEYKYRIASNQRAVHISLHILRTYKMAYLHKMLQQPFPLRKRKCDRNKRNEFMQTNLTLFTREDKKMWKNCVNDFIGKYIK